MQAYTWLLTYLEMIDYSTLYPSRLYLKRDLDNPNLPVEDKVKALLSDSQIQKHLYGDALSSIDLKADPVEYFKTKHPELY